MFMSFEESTDSKLNEFKAEVYDRAQEIDPNDEQDWESLAYGWFLAKGYEIDEARSLALVAACL